MSKIHDRVSKNRAKRFHNTFELSDSFVKIYNNSRTDYFIVDYEDYEKIKATLKLMAHIEEGEKSASEDGWISMEDIESTFGL